ncbi:hypothetical protein P171DRAFT_18875 [Karstenula rhodostoma CBS 690.94]|uniref:Uncharacterized protein n=1 Tax=Karstenula rhodostoma CBS 690.94 TaxID=1392251 RepID=A0A9P4PXK3_9PLEO|nr:hypothetical protein P171DRAFT_18875 [Karstenula rhodostoma CBS 690.94]
MGGTQQHSARTNDDCSGRSGRGARRLGALNARLPVQMQMQMQGGSGGRRGRAPRLCLVALSQSWSKSGHNRTTWKARPSRKEQARQGGRRCYIMSCACTASVGRARRGRASRCATARCLADAGCAHAHVLYRWLVLSSLRHDMPGDPTEMAWEPLGPTEPKRHRNLLFPTLRRGPEWLTDRQMPPRLQLHKHKKPPVG